MKSWHGVCLSLLVALSLHALLLLTVRMAGRGYSEAPAVGVAVEFVSGGEAATRGPFSAKRNAIVVVSTGAARIPASAAFPAVSSQRSEAQPSAPKPVAEASGPTNQAVTQGSGDVTEGVEAAVATGRGGDGGGELQGEGDGGSAVTVPAQPKAEILPSYPRSARNAGFEGVVRIAAFIDNDGRVASVEILSSSGHEALDKAALRAVQRAHFEPARQAGKAVPWHLIIPVRFKQN